MTHHGRRRKSSHSGETLRSRLFCRQSDPHALLVGLDCVDSCRERLGGVARSLGELRDGAADPDGRPGLTGGGPSIEKAVTSVLEAVDELAQCASAIQTTANERLAGSTGEGLRWSTGSRDHYPELLAVEAPAAGTGPQGVGGDEPARVLTRCRLQIAAVKDRYSVVLPGLPWVGPDRDHFTGTRLTKVRVHLESAVEALESTMGDGVGVDLTDAAASSLAV